jgi:hypothetical protein
MIEVHSGSRLSSVIVEAGPVGFGDVEGVAVGPVVAFVGLGAGDDAGVGVCNAVGEIAGFITRPLFQTKFFPDFTQVYLTLAMVLVAVNLLHLVPEIVAEKAVGVERINEASSEPIRTMRLKLALTRTEYL